jgi:hypothetical protein
VAGGEEGERDEVDGCGGDGVEVGEGGGTLVVAGGEEVTGGGVEIGCVEEVDGCGGDGVVVGEGGRMLVAAVEEETGCGGKVDEGGGGTGNDAKISTTSENPGAVLKKRHIFKTAQINTQAPITHLNIFNAITSTSTHLHHLQTEPVLEMAATLH